MPVGQDVTRILVALQKRGLAEEIAAICKRYAVTPEDVCGPSRTKTIVRARHAIWLHLRERDGSTFSYPEIAHLFRRDHTTIMAGVKIARRRAAGLAPTRRRVAGEVPSLAPGPVAPVA